LGVDAGHAHPPFSQLWPGPHTLLQRPQLLGSLTKLKQLVPHRLGVEPEQANRYPSAICIDECKLSRTAYGQVYICGECARGSRRKCCCYGSFLDPISLISK
jgi:hypothetical protein